MADGRTKCHPLCNYCHWKRILIFLWYLDFWKVLNTKNSRFRNILIAWLLPLFHVSFFIWILYLFILLLSRLTDQKTTIPNFLLFELQSCLKLFLIAKVVSTVLVSLIIKNFCMYTLERRQIKAKFMCLQPWTQMTEQQPRWCLNNFHLCAYYALRNIFCYHQNKKQFVALYRANLLMIYLAFFHFTIQYW